MSLGEKKIYSYPLDSEMPMKAKQDLVSGKERGELKARQQATSYWGNEGGCGKIFQFSLSVF